MKNILLIAVLVAIFSIGKCSKKDSKLYKMVYKDFTEIDFDYCFSMFNDTHTVGCQSSQNGDVGILEKVATDAELKLFLSNNKKPSNFKSVALLEEKLFNKTNVMKLIANEKVAGILVYPSSQNKGSDFNWSPASSCPKYQPELYNGTYGSTYENCGSDKQPINPVGDGLLDMFIPMPVFFAHDINLITSLLNCYEQYNTKGSNSFPLCAVEMKSFMHGAVSGEVCTRRNNMNNLLSQSGYCEVVSGKNVYGSLSDLKQLKQKETLILTSPIDSRSLMLYSSSSISANTATGFISLLAAARALGKLTDEQKAKFDKNVLFALLNGEAFDGMGGKRMVSDLKSLNFPSKEAAIEFSSISNVLEVRDIGMVKTNEVYTHYDPVYYTKSSASIDEMQNTLKSGPFNVTKGNPNMGIPPSIIQTILRSREVPHLLVTDYADKFTNKHYQSRYDTLQNIGVKYNGNETEEEMLKLIEPLAKKIADVAQTLAISSYKISQQRGTVDIDTLKNITTDVEEVGSLIYCFLVNSSCSYFNNYIQNNFPNNFAFNGRPIPRYVGPQSSRVKLHTEVISVLLSGYLGSTKKGVKENDCNNQNFNNHTGQIYYMKNDLRNLEMNVSSCLVAPVIRLDGYAAPEDGGNNWSESIWDNNSIGLRMFLVTSTLQEAFVFIGGLIFFLTTTFFVYKINKNLQVLFPSTAIPSSIQQSL